MKKMYSHTILANLRGWLHWKRIEIETTLLQQPDLADAMASETHFANDIERLLTEHDRFKAALERIHSEATDNRIAAIAGDAINPQSVVMSE